MTTLEKAVKREKGSPVKRAMGNDNYNEGMKNNMDYSATAGKKSKPVVAKSLKLKPKTCK